MQIIIKNWTDYSLTNIPDDELEIVKENNEEIIDDFTITENEKELISNWATFIYTNKIEIIDSSIAVEKIKTEANEKIREDKRIAIEKIATPSDQLNIIASILNTLTSETPDLQLIADAKAKFAEIEAVLATPYIK